MRRRRLRPGIGPALLVLIAAGVFLLALFAPASEDENHRVVLDLRPALEVLVLIGIVALLRLIGLRLPARLRYAIALVVLLAALFNLAQCRDAREHTVVRSIFIGISDWSPACSASMPNRPGSPTRPCSAALLSSPRSRSCC
jgi:lysylphosphatidylglycerol synthetase-like protein (DUF2156 family)